MEYRVFLLDLSREDFLTKLDRLLSKRCEEASLTGAATVRTVQDAIPALKKVLKEWHSLPRNPALVETYDRLFPNRRAGGKASGRTGQAVQRELLEAMHSLMGGGEREAVLGKLLKYAYTQDIRTHERAAERLNLSMATYYRYLNKATERLYRMLRDGI
jgi:hypothetical protein